MIRLAPHLPLRRLCSTTTTVAGAAAPSMAAAPAAADAAIAYHNRTKHGLPPASYARGPGRLDWANQPNPFLRFTSSPSLPLPLPPPPPSFSIPFPSLFCAAAGDAAPPPPLPLSLDFVSSLLYHSLALSAWKKAGASQWSLRVNPSSGNLHPTEAHVLLPPLDSSTAAARPCLFHYSPRDHSLEARLFLDEDAFSNLTAAVPAAAASGAFLLVLSSVFWREAWKYGERAFRYCNHDVGHAVAAVAIAAASLGWDCRLLDGLSHGDLESLTGVRKTYPEMPRVDELPQGPARGSMPWMEVQHPDCALLLFPLGTEPQVDYGSLSIALKDLERLKWLGKPNVLSKEHVVWDVIYKVAEAVKKHETAAEERFSVGPLNKSILSSPDSYSDLSVFEVVRKRRSAVDMDGKHMMDRETFYQIMLRCLPSGEICPGEKQGLQFALPFCSLPWDAEVHAALFVHRVADLPMGLYFLVRNEEHLGDLKQAMRSEFIWAKPVGCPEGLPLYILAKGDFQQLAMQLSCFQDIASHGCFSLGMLARFKPVLHGKGAWMYPRLFWETGVLGQVLYLEAHAVGISATGIGCYFDDAVHEVLGLRGMEFQSLYHFTVGSPVLDNRIMSLPAYPGPKSEY